MSYNEVINARPTAHILCIRWSRKMHLKGFPKHVISNPLADIKKRKDLINALPLPVTYKCVLVDLEASAPSKYQGMQFPPPPCPVQPSKHEE